jgi:hypothetical protein
MENPFWVNQKIKNSPSMGILPMVNQVWVYDPRLLYFWINNQILLGSNH